MVRCIVSEIESREKIFPTQLRRVDHFVDAVGCLLIEARPSVGVDEWIVWNFLVEDQVEFILEIVGLTFGEIRVDNLWNRHFANPFHKTSRRNVFCGFVGHGCKRGDFGGFVGEHGNELFVSIGGERSMNVQMNYSIGHGICLLVQFELSTVGTSFRVLL